VVPKSLPDQVRSDVAQDMILGVLSGEISVNGKCRSIITKYYKGYDNRFRTLSLDQPVSGPEKTHGPK
jgi:hypothetical protein